MVASDDLTPPEQHSSIDDGRHLFLTGVGLIPTVGPLFQAVLDRIIPQEAQQRRAEWEQRVKNAVERLQSKAQGAVNSEEFFSLFVRASEQARRTHQQQKLDALEAALSNAASDLPYDLKDLFLRYLDDLTILHLKLFKIVSVSHFQATSDRTWGKELLYSFARHDLKGQISLANALLNELDGVKKLVVYSNPGGVPQQYIELTELGVQFYHFLDIQHTV